MKYLQEEERSIPAKLPKPRSKYCKKLKGDHQFGGWERYYFSWKPKEHTGLWNRFCIACNKKETWAAPALPGPYYKLDLDARPPEYEKTK